MTPVQYQALLNNLATVSSKQDKIITKLDTLITSVSSLADKTVIIDDTAAELQTLKNQIKSLIDEATM